MASFKDKQAKYKGGIIMKAQQESKDLTDERDSIEELVEVKHFWSGGDIVDDLVLWASKLKTLGMAINYAGRLGDHGEIICGNFVEDLGKYDPGLF